MRYIELTETESRELSYLYKNSPYVVERKRSHCLLLSSSGKNINELCSIFQVSRLTVTNWFNRWESDKKAGVLLRAGRGRKKKLADLDIELIKEYVQAHCRNLNAVVALLKEKHGIRVSKKTLQRFLKI